MESKYVHKAHNVSVLRYHMVCAAKYRRVVKLVQTIKSMTAREVFAQVPAMRQ